MRSTAVLLGLVCWVAVACDRGAVSTPDVEVRVDTLAVDPTSNSPVVILEELEGRRRLPIWIGFAEAQSIAAELERAKPVRPNTHDLTKRLIDRLEGAVERIVVTELSEGIYYARIQLRAPNGRVDVDARPSDAIAIGLRYGAPLFVRERLFDQSFEAVVEGEGQRIRAPAPHRQVRAGSA